MHPPLAAAESMRKVLNSVRNRYLRSRSPFYFISFPKSGRTWVRSFLANYYSCYTEAPLSYDLAPLLKVGGGAGIPRIMFSHAKHRAEQDSEAHRFMEKLQNKKIVLAVRDPQHVVFSYYFRLIKRMVDEEARSMDFPRFVRHESLGIPRIIKFMNEWYEYRNRFRAFLLLRYEDCVKDPETQFTRLLEYLAVPCDVKSLQQALVRSVDTTRKIEEGGQVRDQDLIDRIARGSQFFETADGDRQFVKRYAGDETAFTESFTVDDLHYISAAMKKLNPVFGYRSGGPG